MSNGDVVHRSLARLARSESVLRDTRRLVASSAEAVRASYRRLRRVDRAAAHLRERLVGE